MADPKRLVPEFVELNVDTPAPADSQSTPYGTAAHHGVFPIPGYELMEQIGRGGMGVVYKARQVALNRHVAIKLLPNVEQVGPNAVARFFAEAQSVAEVRHPNVVDVYDFGQVNGVPYLVMELLDGGHLGDLQRAEQRRDPWAMSVTVAKVCRGVAAAHKAGIVHRDLKPNNILFTRFGEPKVVDFGLAKRAMSNLTQSVAVMGTPYYMSPEQAKGKSKLVGPPTDVWALGAMLYECLAGCRPFDADNQFSLLHQIITEEPESPRIHNAELPPALEAIVLKCLRKNPDQRFPTAGKLAEALERFSQDGVELVPRAAAWAVRWGQSLAALGVVALILALFGISGTALWLWQNAEAEKRELHQKARELQSAGERGASAP
ncbi:serine/threonine-protein kinase [Limnoglobus roseus]|uniref:non-specific serine/threonine protein kinase n=1 Tax=Limnoglobus roseus TaxID=2598579 RepID=A0A5C1ACP9_9BACT|nr:serine/threonine-protein kinase [Limnoglobus roseus]QEL16520.1 serine/threonine protein kinase [Limnoglobus roseus]